MSELSNRHCFRAAIFVQLVVLGILAAVPATAIAESPASRWIGRSAGRFPILPGKTISATVPLSSEEKTYAAIGENRVPTSAVATLAAPPGFDPGNSWPVLVVFSTSDSHRENRGDIPFYSVKERGSHGAFRSQPSTLNCSGYLAGVNEDLLREGYRTFHPGPDFLNTSIFITSGQGDKIATPAQTERVMRSIRANGFRQVRLETFPEGHNVKRPLTVAALRWFHSGSPAVLPEVGTVAGSRLGMEAKEIGSGAQRKIVVTLSDPSGKAGAITAHVYFIGKASNGGARFIYAHSDLSVNLRGAAAASARVNVVELKSDAGKRAPAGFAYTGVGEMEGWIATAQENGKTFQVRASSPALRDVAQERSHDSLKAMVADYEKRSAEPARRP